MKIKIAIFLSECLKRNKKSLQYTVIGCGRASLYSDDKQIFCLAAKNKKKLFF